MSTLSPEKALEISVKARKLAKAMLSDSGDQPTCFAEYKALVEQCQRDLIQEMQDEQDEAKV